MELRLEFDRGTIRLSGFTAAEAARLPGVLWDPRVRAHRAPAYHHAALVGALADAGLAFDDRVASDDGVHESQRWSTPELRPYQSAALTAWELGGRRGLVALPTGSGKTRLAIAAISASRARALCLVPTRLLLEQWRGVLGEHCAGPIGQYGDGLRNLEAVTVATFASAFHHMPSIGNRFDLLVVDEAHHFGTGANDETLELCTARSRLGLTGTPPESFLQQSRLDELIGPVVYRQSVSDLTGEFLAPLQIVSLLLDLSKDERQHYDEELAVYQPVVRQFFRYTPRATWREFQNTAVRTDTGRRALAAWRRSRKLVAFTEAKRETLSRLLVEHRRGRLLVFTGGNETAYTIAREHCIMPITSDIGRVERKSALECFRSGELGALVSAQVLNEGIDLPDVDTAIVAGGRLGTREYLQRIGRLLRPAPDKQALVYELVMRDTHEQRDATRRQRAL